MQACVGMRPAEIYGLRWADLDLRSEEVHVERQYSPRTRSFEGTPMAGPSSNASMAIPQKLSPASESDAR
jgi:integrase